MLQVEVEMTQPVFGVSLQQGHAHDKPHLLFMDLRHIPAIMSLHCFWRLGKGRATPRGLKPNLGSTPPVTWWEDGSSCSSPGMMPTLRANLCQRFLSMQGEGHSSFLLTSASSPGERCEQSWTKLEGLPDELLALLMTSIHL